jgi:hypothetical protein
MMVTVEQLVEWRFTGETELLGINLPQRHFVHHKSHMTRTGRRGGKPATNSLSYGAVYEVSDTNPMRNSYLIKKKSLQGGEGLDNCFLVAKVVANV